MGVEEDGRHLPLRVLSEVKRWIGGEDDYSFLLRVQRNRREVVLADRNQYNGFWGRGVGDRVDVDLSDRSQWSQTECQPRTSTRVLREHPISLT